jgi:hypothetical protein
MCPYVEHVLDVYSFATFLHRPTLKMLTGSLCKETLSFFSNLIRVFFQNGGMIGSEFPDHIFGNRWKRKGLKILLEQSSL